ncbi:alpha-glucoside-specific PTS transporter subunit IIBC [Entomospira nematocerorum]|nr:alpha-glucoside-specific PTS transporter subunit IIBC [Entomospira nematocera]WDI33626.1 alpha-glucoside-specific PTS transporter subunit IIBC [Entomospira nematocera]
MSAFEKVQKFGAAMFVSVMLFPFVGVLIAIIQVLGMVDALAGISDFLGVLESGAWAVFTHMSILFAIGIPISLATKAPARAVLVTFITFLTFNYFINAILSTWPEAFRVDFTQEPGGVSGLTTIAGIKTLDMSILGGIMVGFIMTAIHNRFYDKKLPDYLGVFQGVSLVAAIGFFVMVPLAFLVVLIWPVIQSGIISLQDFLIKAGPVGVWLYTFLERLLIPTGLHHFVYGPFIFGPAVVEGGIQPYWLAHFKEFSQSTTPLKELFPVGFSLHGNSKVFGLPAAALAMYHTAKPENKAKMAGLLLPAAITAALTGITEPLEFTFIFVAPLLFVVHAFLGATMSTLMYLGGVVGNMGGGGMDIITSFWIPMSKNHLNTVLIHIGIGLSFSVIYYFVFKFLILKYDLPTPGRGDSEAKLYKKADYKEREASKQTQTPHKELGKKGDFTQQAATYLALLGGKENIETVSNCMTRLRVKVKDKNLISSKENFLDAGASGVVAKEESYQIIIGLDVQNVRDEFDKLL